MCRWVCLCLSVIPAFQWVILNQGGGVGKLGGAVQYTGVVGRCRGHHTHHLLLYYHSPGMYMVLQINQKCCFFNYKKLKYANLTLLRDSVL